MMDNIINGKEANKVPQEMQPPHFLAQADEVLGLFHAGSGGLLLSGHLKKLPHLSHLQHRQEALYFGLHPPRGQSTLSLYAG